MTQTKRKSYSTANGAERTRQANKYCKGVRYVRKRRKRGFRRELQAGSEDGSNVPKGPKGAALSERAARVLRESSRISRLQRVGNEACLCGLSHHLQYKSCTVPKLYSTKVDIHELLAKDYLLVTFEKRIILSKTQQVLYSFLRLPMLYYSHLILSSDLSESVSCISYRR